MSFLETSHARLYYEDSPASLEKSDCDSAVLFINGWAMSARYWAPAIQMLNARYRTVAFDQSGAGRTVFKQRPAFTIEHFADEASELIAFLNLKKIHLVGHSMGSMVVSELAHLHQEKVASTVIIGCGIFKFSAVQMEILSAFVRGAMNLKFLFHFDFFKQAFIRKAASQPIPEAFEKILLDDFLNTDAEAAEKVGTFSLNQRVLERYEHRALSIPSPLLLMVGDLDKTIPPEGMTALFQTRKSTYPNLPAKLLSFSNVGHLPMLECIPEFSTALANHFESAEKKLAENRHILSV
jgi:pimeloyl-ACP methyl ester carboxylesterase